jgi:formylglycine-generating enzyme required for sulfatase activity
MSKLLLAAALSLSCVNPSYAQPGQMSGKSVAEKQPAPAATSHGFTDPATGMEFVPVPGGCFQMGDTFGDVSDRDKSPVHEVCVSDFSIGKYEVTQGQWRRVMGSNPSHFSNCGDDCPVEKVSWNDAQEFIARLNRQSGKTYRLPTEAEWEYACRSGGKKEKYCGGDNADEVAWYEGNSGGKTHRAGAKQPNGLGIYDMSGNVWEWVQDWYKRYESGRQQDPAGPSSGDNRVLRGGSWNNSAWIVRAALRFNYKPDSRYNNHGFRLASPAVQ